MSVEKLLKHGRGGFRAGAGRPVGTKTGPIKPDEERKLGRIVVACTIDEMERIKAMAQDSGKSVSRFVIDSLLHH